MEQIMTDDSIHLVPVLVGMLCACDHLTLGL